MYFFGAFENLLWDSLKDTHGPIWNSALMQGILPYAYKTIPSLLFGAHEFTTPPSLSDLASFCVDICGESLFPHLMSGLNAEPILFPTRNSYQYFKPWLCDHLIMTFAYCFCHDTCYGRVVYLECQSNLSRYSQRLSIDRKNSYFRRRKPIL